MEKILIVLEVPSISENYDVYIPDFLEIREAVPLLAKSVEQMSNYHYVSSGCEFLCLKEKKLLLKQEKTFCNYGIKNGDHLVLL